LQKLKLMCMYYKEIHIDTNTYPFHNIQCGKAFTNINLDMDGDDTGQSISIQNPFWSEITGLYWAWKNFDECEYVGLCSYRRFFNFIESNEPVHLLLIEDGQEYLKEINYDIVTDIMSKNDVILPEPYTYAWSIRRVCSMNYKDEDFDKLEAIILDKSPDYLPAYKKLMYGSNTMVGHNMFIMKWLDYNAYCEWVFSILLPLSALIDASDYPLRQQRVFGYMHELLLAVFIEKNKMKVFNSQIVWVNDGSVKSKFNSKLYRFIAKSLYKVTSKLGRYYPHIIKQDK